MIDVACFYAIIATALHRNLPVFSMIKALPSEYFIQGVTEGGQRFRPSDWPERLCGVMSSFGPGASGPNARLKYSFYVRPVMVGDLKCVVVDERLRTLEPAAFDF